MTKVRHNLESNKFFRAGKEYDCESAEGKEKQQD